MEHTLLPSGFHDLLPPRARQQAAIVQQALAVFASFGCEQVTPPLMEFEDSLLSGRGAALSSQTFRVMDPLSHAMMGFRADMTMQIARIASSRLGDSPRPLRLSYAGQTLQVSPDPLTGARQFHQAGVELIGSAAPDADAEIILMATEALAKLGIADVTVDLHLPGLVAAIVEKPDETSRATIAQAFALKDTQLLERLSLPEKELLMALMQSAGDAKTALKKLQALALPDAAKQQCAQAAEIITIVSRSSPDLRLTIDPVETRGFEYHQGVSFSFFARGARSELGRGGRYSIAHHGGEEAATGFTFYISALLDVAPEPEPSRRVLVPYDVTAAESRRLREQGFTTVHAHQPGADLAGEAKRQTCTHIYEKGEVKAV